MYIRIPNNIKTIRDAKKSPEGDLSTPEKTIAITLAAFLRYQENMDDGIRILDYVKGPNPTSAYERQFIRDRFRQNGNRFMFSYLQGSTPENNYTPTEPWMLKIHNCGSPYNDDKYVKYEITCGGADTPRTVILRYKPSTNQWFLWEQYLLVGIKKSAFEDPWG